VCTVFSRFAYIPGEDASSTGERKAHPPKDSPLNIHERRDSRKTLSLPLAVLEVYPEMTQEIPLYAADGTPWGFRSLETAQRLIANGLVSPAYGRKGHLKAIFSKKADGSSPVELTGHRGTRYSFQDRLASGCLAWRLKKLGKGEELRPLFQQVVTDCLSNP